MRLEVGGEAPISTFRQQARATYRGPPVAKLRGAVVHV
jgi:hypothetical protein